MDMIVLFIWLLVCLYQVNIYRVDKYELTDNAELEPGTEDGGRR